MEYSKFNKLYIIVLIVLACVFFFIYSAIALNIWLPNYQQLSHIIYSWPDAMANQAFINQFIESGNFIIPVEYNTQVGNIIHPRSVNVFEGNIVPMSFLGIMLIYGILGKIVSIAGTLFLTPFFACLSVLFFYSLLKRVVSARAAFISSMLLFTSAPFWYYSSLVMLHAVLFIAVLIIAFWFLTYKNPDHHSRVVVFRGLGAFLIGVSLLIRTIEAPWVLLLCLVLLIYDRDKWPLKLLLFIICFSLAFVPLLWQNHVLYGEYISSGYLSMDEQGNFMSRLPTEFTAESKNFYFKMIKIAAVPFGFHPRLMWSNFVKYFVNFYKPYIFLSLLGILAYFFEKEKKKRHWQYFSLVVLAFSWLIFYYGNWLFFDENVLRYNLIGSSYVRYWLPLYIILLPGIGYLFDRLIKFKVIKIQKILIYFFMVLAFWGLIYYSYTWTYKSTYDGLYKSADNLQQYYNRYESVQKLIQKEDLLIVDKTDKIFFPQFEVVVFLDNYNIFPEIKKIIQAKNIYYVTRRSADDIENINQTKMTQFNLYFEEPRVIDDEYQLYKVSAY